MFVNSILLTTKQLYLVLYTAYRFIYIVIRFWRLQKAPACWVPGQFQGLGVKARGRLLAGKFTLSEDISGLLTGGGVHVEVLEEDLGATGGRSATFGVVLGLDVDGRGHRSVRVIEGRSLAVGAGDTVALGFGGLDDEFQVGDIAGDVCQGEGHRGCSEGDSRLCRSLNTGKVRHSGHNAAAAVHDPVVEPHEQIGARNLVPNHSGGQVFS